MSENYANMQSPICPIPLQSHDHVVISHGSGGGMTHDLICNVFRKYLGNTLLNAGNDGAVIQTAAVPKDGSRLVLSTDAHVVSPLSFAGGDIGRLAICGTVNDIAMMGAQPAYLTATFILEEGLPIHVLEEMLVSMQAACEEAGVLIIAADTKVTEKGKSDGLFISTSGIGWVPEHLQIGGDQAKPGDAILISGTIGNHGVAVLQARGNLGFLSEVQSDIAPLNHMVSALLNEIPEVHVLRDPTRGGLATTLVEIARQSNCALRLDEAAIPIETGVQTACELLGLDPLYMANEGKMIVILPQHKADRALQILHDTSYGKGAVQIGTVQEKPAGLVTIKTLLGTNRILDMLTGEMLPRIC